MVLSPGKAAVYTSRYPGPLGAVGGLVGMIRGLSGFVLPVAFGIIDDLTAV